MRYIKVVCYLLLFFAAAGCSNEQNRSAKGDFLNRDYTAIEEEIKAWTDSLMAVAERLDLKELNAYHIYSDKFTRISNSPGRGAVRMDKVAGKKWEDDGFSSIDRFEGSFSDIKIDVLSERHAIVSMIYNARGFKNGKPVNEPVDRWATFVIVKPEKKWRIIYENIVVAG